MEGGRRYSMETWMLEEKEAFRKPESREKGVIPWNPGLRVERGNPWDPLMENGKMHSIRP